MKATPIRDLLAAQAVFGALESTDLDLLAGCAQNEVFEAGALLAHEGRPADRFFVVRAGRVATEFHAPGSSLVVDTAGAGGIVGWSWLLPPYRWTTDVRAIERARVVTIDGLCLRTKCEQEASFGYRMMKRFALLMTEQLDAMRLQLLDLYGLRRGP